MVAMGRPRSLGRSMSRLRNRNRSWGIVCGYHAAPRPGTLFPPCAAPCDRPIVTDLSGPAARWRASDLQLYLVGVYGVAFALTGVWLGMRSVMDIGGSCASGGP